MAADQFFEVFKKPNGKFTYQLKTRGNKVLAKGRSFPTKKAANSAIQRLKNVVPAAPVEERPED